MTIIYTLHYSTERSCRKKKSHCARDGAFYHANLSKAYWAKVFNTAVHILNCVPTKVVAEKTPYKVFTGKRPSIAYF